MVLHKFSILFLYLKIFFSVKNNSSQKLAQAKNSTNRFEPRSLDSEGIFFGEGNNNKFSSPINSTKSWFEHFITPTLKQSEQLRLNTTSNRKSNFLSNANKTITNATVVAAEHLVTLDSKESFAKSISFGQDGMLKLTKSQF